MKPVSLFTFALFSLISLNVFAQTPKEIEADLLKSFNKIDYWDAYRSTHKDTINNLMKANDSLDKACSVFGKKLKYYTSEFPFTIEQKFTSIAQNPNLIPQDRVKILTSADKLFRIYSWDTRSDGTMYFFNNVIQYKTGQKTKSILITDTASGHMERYVDYYSHLYTVKIKNKTYYLAVYIGAYTHIETGQGIQIFAIENGTLNDSIKLIKTQTGLHSQLYYEYYFDGKKDDDILYDDSLKTISIPVVQNNRVMKKRILYKFTGQYFERVKN